MSHMSHRHHACTFQLTCHAKTGEFLFTLLILVIINYITLLFFLNFRQSPGHKVQQEGIQIWCGRWWHTKGPQRPNLGPEPSQLRDKQSKPVPFYGRLSVSQSVGRSVSQPVCQSVSQSVSQLVSEWVCQSVRQSVSQSVIESVSQSVSQSVSEWVC